MNFLSILKSRKDAMIETLEDGQLSSEQQSKFKFSLQFMDGMSYLSKGIIIAIIIFGVNWKKQVSFFKRELPLAVSALALSAALDYGISQYVWSQHQETVEKKTGFRNGLYMNPKKMKSMSKMKNAKVFLDLQDEELMEDQRLNIS